MAKVRHGRILWPGAKHVEAGVYTIGHGITPGVATLKISPQKGFVQPYGDLIFTDGVASVAIPLCKVANYKAHREADGACLTLEIYDRRWRWKDCGFVNGFYNVIDPKGFYALPLADGAGPRLAPEKKYLPWTVATPVQLAAFLLDTMGEINYTINLPPTTTLPPISWDYSNPAQMLQQLCESYGRRIVYRLDTNTVAILPVGDGLQLPGGDVFSDSGTLGNLGKPDGIICVGSPTRWQHRFWLEAVGEEWNGQLKPINALSYAPASSAVAQVSRATPSVVAIGRTFTIQIDGNNYTFTATAGTVANVTAGLAAAINASPLLQGQKVVATDDTTHVTVRGNPNGTPFLFVTDADGDARLTTTWITTAKKGDPSKKSWEKSAPPTFANLRATDQLTKQQAIALARKCVFKMYRVCNFDPIKRKPPLILPNFGAILRREQLILQSEMVQQIIPEADDKNFIGADGQPLNVNFYDGLPRNKPARAIGAYWFPGTGVIAKKNVRSNTQDNEHVHVPFSVDAERQMIVFSQPVFFRDKSRIQPAELVLETAVEVRSPGTNQIVRAERVFEFPGAKNLTAPQVIRRPDFQANYASVWDADGKTSYITTVSDVADAVKRADYYISLAALQWEITEARARSYNGIQLIVCDGAIQQVTWEVNDQGVTTTRASRNSEHDYYSAPYGTRLVLENLSAANREQNNARNLAAAQASPGEAINQ